MGSCQVWSVSQSVSQSVICTEGRQLLRLLGNQALKLIKYPKTVTPTPTGKIRLRIYATVEGGGSPLSRTSQGEIKL